MKKVRIHLKIISKEEQTEFNTTGFLNEENNSLTFQHDEEKSKYQLDFKNNVLIKENPEMKFQFCFLPNQESNNSYFLKEIGAKFDLLIYTEKLLVNKYQFQVKYHIPTENQVNEPITLLITWEEE